MFSRIQKVKELRPALNRGFLIGGGKEKSDDVAKKEDQVDKNDIETDGMETDAIEEILAQSEKRKKEIFSSNALEMLTDDYIDNCGESVSSMNDSIYFGGGASVTGGYSRKHMEELGLEISRDGSTAEKPIKLLGEDDEEIGSVESTVFSANKSKPTPAPKRKGQYEMVDSDFVSSLIDKHLAASSTKISPTVGPESDKDNDNDDDELSVTTPKVSVHRSRCSPPPRRLKVILLGSIVFLVLAVVMIAVALTAGKSNKTSSSEKEEGNSSSTKAPFDIPVPIDHKKATSAPQSEEDDEQDIFTRDEDNGNGQQIKSVFTTPTSSPAEKPHVESVLQPSPTSSPVKEKSDEKTDEKTEEKESKETEVKETEPPEEEELPTETEDEQDEGKESIVLTEFPTQSPTEQKQPKEIEAPAEEELLTETEVPVKEAEDNKSNFSTESPIEEKQPTETEAPAEEVLPTESEAPAKEEQPSDTELTAKEEIPTETEAPEEETPTEIESQEKEEEGKESNASTESPTEQEQPKETEAPANDVLPTETEEPAKEQPSETESPAKEETPTDTEYPATAKKTTETDPPAIEETPTETENPAIEETPTEIESPSNEEASTETESTATEETPNETESTATEETLIETEAPVIQETEEIIITAAPTAITFSPSKSPTNSPTKSPTNAPTKSPTNSPTKPPTNSLTKSPTNFPTKSPTNNPTKSPTNNPTKSPTNPPTFAPFTAPTNSPVVESAPVAPTVSPTAAPVPTFSPTQAPTEFDTKSQYIYITAGRYSDNVYQQAMNELPNLAYSPDGSSFLVHLGDWIDISEGNCKDEDYEEIMTLFELSSVPVYFLMGESEYTMCPNAQKADEMWKKNLLDFETTYFADPPWEVYRQADSSLDYQEYSENFLFLYNKVVFVSINLLNENIYDESDLTTQRQANMLWIDAAYNFFQDEKISTIVIFTHDPPMVYHEEFFNELFYKIKESYKDVDFVFIHREDSQLDIGADPDIKNLEIVSVLGSIWPPARMRIRDGRVVSIG